MFLSRSLSIALIDVSCKSSHRIVKLMPSVRACYPDSDDYALEQERRTARTRRGRKEWDNRDVKGTEMSRAQKCQRSRSVEGAEVSREQRCQRNRDVESAEVSKEQKCRGCRGVESARSVKGAEVSKVQRSVGICGARPALPEE
jgi:hypothetical protein